MLDSTQRRQVAKLLMQTATLRDPDTRATFAQQIDERIALRWNRNTGLQADMLNLVLAADQFEGGIQSIIDVLEFFEEDSIPMQELLKYWDSINATSASNPASAEQAKTSINSGPTIGTQINNYLGNNNTFSGSNISIGNNIGGSLTQSVTSNQPIMSENERQAHIKNLRERLQNVNRTLNVKEIEVSKFGSLAPQHMLDEIADLKKQRAEIKQKIAELEQD